MPQFDSLGRVSSAPFVDPWEARAGVAMAMEKIAKFIPSDQVKASISLFN